MASANLNPMPPEPRRGSGRLRQSLIFVVVMLGLTSTAAIVVQVEAVKSREWAAIREIERIGGRILTAPGEQSLSRIWNSQSVPHEVEIPVATDAVLGHLKVLPSARTLPAWRPRP
jgi:hypothetical protein